MSNILSELNNRISQDVKSGVESAPAGEDIVNLSLQKYKDLQASGKTFKVVFSSVDPEGNFATVMDDYTVVMPAERFMEHGKSTRIYATGMLIGVELHVVVYDIDEEGKRVFVKMDAKSSQNFESSMRNEIIASLGRELNAGKKPVVWGRVVSVTETRLIVSILDRNVLGFLHKKHWGKDFVHSLEPICKVGDFFQFEVIGKAPKMEGKAQAFILSRTNLATSVWDNVSLDGLKADGVIMVRCTSKPSGKTYWWGAADRLPGVGIMGDFTSSFNYRKDLYVGISYKCKIKSIDKEKRRISVIPFEVCPADVPKLERLRNTTNIHRLGSF